MIRTGGGLASDWAPTVRAGVEGFVAGSAGRVYPKAGGL